MTPPRNEFMAHITRLYLEHRAAIRSACDAPEPAPEHVAAVEAILRERAAADGDDVERIIRALEQGKTAKPRQMPRG
jgi:hypothetical protein